MRRSTMFLLSTLLAIYASARILEIYPGPLTMPVVVALHVVPALLFGLIHGTTLYGWRGMLVFFTACMVIGNVIENVGVATGFPFGDYYFTDQMGPKILHVPILLGLAYVGMGYLAWVVARLIVGRDGKLLSTSIVAAFAMVAWDLAQDPTWSTIVRCWVWPHGGPYFGVPLSNFIGWYVTVFCIYLTLALYLRRQYAHSGPRTQPKRFWGVAVAFYWVSAAGNVLPALRSTAAIVTDPSGRVWRVRDINIAAALVSLVTMGTFAVIAWAKLRAANAGSENPQRATTVEAGD